MTKGITDEWYEFWRMVGKVIVVLAVMCIAICMVVQTASAAHWVAGTSDSMIEGMTVIAYISSDKSNYTSDIVGREGNSHFRNYYMIDVEMIPNYKIGVGDQMCIELIGSNNQRSSIVTVNLTGAGWDLALNLD